MIRFRWILLAGCLGLAAAGYLYRYQIVWSLFDFLGPSEGFNEAEPAPDYESPDAWAVFDTKKSAEVSVFYVHPTTHLLADTWNQTLQEARQDQMLLSQILPGQIRPFAEQAVFAPHYRQAIFYAVALRDEDAHRAVHLARRDVERAFDRFLSVAPTEKIAIVGHSQGSFHLMGLLSSLRDRPHDLDRIVAAYLIGYPIPLRLVTSGALSLPQCGADSDSGCVMSYNTRGPNAYIPRQVLEAPVIDGDSDRNLRDEPILCWNPIDGDSLVRGICRPDGWLELEGVPERYTQFLMSKDWYHTGEIPMFERELREDLARRLAASMREGSE